MCGIAGIVGYDLDASPVQPIELLQIRDHMVRRGPDSSGVWISHDGRVGLAHRRLTIIDLSDAGAQPMSTPDGKVRIVFNGEIYNYREIRDDLECRGYRFRSSSDTEVLLYLYVEKGRDFLNDLQGMYALALWDENKQGLLLARDPYGIKPLYYSDNGTQVRFASQVKALLASGTIDTSPDPAGHVGFFLWGHMPPRNTLYRNIKELPAGHLLWIDASGIRVEKPFCEIVDEIRRYSRQRPEISPEEACERLHQALRDSVKKHLIADVEVSTFLSAGLDSSLVLALGMESSNRSLKAITMAFPEYRDTEMDEAPAARTIAQYYNAEHRVPQVDPKNFQDELPSMLKAMDQPTIDGINTYCVSKVASGMGVKVALSGLGGDEIFGGYPSFQSIPMSVRKLHAFRPNSGFGKGFRWVSAPIIKRFTSVKYAGLFEYGGSYAGAYLLRRGLFMPWELPRLLDPDMVRDGWNELQTLAALNETIRGIDSDHCTVAALEMTWYMRNQLLRDADWAGMAHSLEIRVPLVDIQLLRDLAPLMWTDRPPTKRDAARSLSKPLPESIVNRPKTGFNVPVREWLIGTHGSQFIEPGYRSWAKYIYKSFCGN